MAANVYKRINVNVPVVIMVYVVNFVSISLSWLYEIRYIFLIFSAKCEISCMHGGRCIGTNLCRCAEGLSGDHCEIGHRQRPTCKRKCKHGDCVSNKTCKCKEGFYGRFCNRRKCFSS